MLLSYKAKLRHAQHYAEEMNYVNRLYLTGGTRMLSGLQLFDQERTQIDDGWTWLLNQEPDTEIDSLLLSYANSIAYIGELRYDVHHELIPRFQAALQAAQRLRHLEAESAVLGNLGNAYAMIGEYRQAMAFYEQQLTIARSLGDRRGEANALGNLGVVYRDVGELHQAQECYQEQLTIARSLGDRRGEANALGNLGVVYRDVGELRPAIACLEEAIEIYRASGDIIRESTILNNLGIIYSNLENFSTAINNFEQAIQIHHKTGNRLGAAIASWNLGLVYTELGDLQESVGLMRNYVVFAREAGLADAKERAVQLNQIEQRLDKTSISD